MRGTTRIFLAVAALGRIGHAARAEPNEQPIAADLIVKVGRIWTGDRERPWAEALAARSGEIIAVGSCEDVLRLRGPNTRVVDQPEAFAVPGLIDAHGHLSDLGAVGEDIDLRGVDRLNEVARRVKERIDTTPGDSWIKGQNWDQSLWPGGAYPTAAVLDEVAPGRPVWLRRIDDHAGWANSEALRRAGVTKETRDPPGGQIVRDRDGRPTGIFIDAARGLISRQIPPLTKADLTRHLLYGQSQALEAGLTGVHDAGVSRLEVEAYRDLDRVGRLKLRVYGMASVPDPEKVACVSRPPLADRMTGPGRFELRAIKLFIDGAMGSRGALLFEPYSDEPGHFGLPRTDPRLVAEVTTAALRNGWQVCTHAIGDRGNALVLDAYQTARRAVPEAKAPRLRIEHAQVIRKADVARFAELEVIASMQPSHAVDDMRWAEARLGSARSEGAYAWRWFLDARVPLAFGSDFPVAIASPFYGLHAALTRQDTKGKPPGGWHPGQKLSLDEALRAFTAGSAFAGFAEDQLGILKRGMRADVTVVDRDLFRIEPADVSHARVLLSIIDGEVVFDRTKP